MSANHVRIQETHIFVCFSFFPRYYMKLWLNCLLKNKVEVQWKDLKSLQNTIFSQMYGFNKDTNFKIPEYNYCILFSWASVSQRIDRNYSNCGNLVSTELLYDTTGGNILNLQSIFVMFY